MNRRQLIQGLAGTSFIAVAGCSSTSPDNTPEKTQSLQQTTTQTGISHPAGFSSEGITNLDQVISSHKDFLMSLSDYTENWKLKTINSDGETEGPPTETAVRTSPTDRRLHLDYADHRWDLEVFYDGTFYEYNISKDEVSEGQSNTIFTEVAKNFEPLTFWATNLLLKPVLETIKLTSETRITVRGNEGVKYSVTGVAEDQKNENVTYQGAEGQVLVTEVGGIVHLQYTPLFESETTSLQTASLEVTNIGQTTVTRPTWLE